MAGGHWWKTGSRAKCRARCSRSQSGMAGTMAKAVSKSSFLVVGLVEDDGDDDDF